MLIKQKRLLLTRNSALVTFGELLIVDLNLDDLGISLPTFLSRTNLKLHDIHVTPKLVKKVMTNLYISKISGLDCISVVVPKKCWPESSYLLFELFNICLKDSYFPECWKVSSMGPVFKRSMTKNYHPVSEVFERHVNNKLVDHLKKCDLLSDIQYGSRSSPSTADTLTAVSDRITRAFSRSRTTLTVALDILKAFDRVWHAGLLHKFKFFVISSQVFGFILFFLSNRMFCFEHF